MSENGKLDPSAVLVRYGASALAACVENATRELESSANTPDVVATPDDPVTLPDGASPVTTTSSPGNFDPHQIRFTYGNRSYRVDGFAKNMSAGSLAITLHAEVGGELFIEQLQLYSAKERERFVRLCAKSLGCEEELIATDLSAMLKALRSHQDHMLEDATKLKTKDIYSIPADRKNRALEFLSMPDYHKHFASDARSLGLVGEELNFELGFYILISRLFSRPLHGKVKSASAAGKSTLLDLFSRICPPEDLIRLSAISSQALYYMEDLSHKVIVLEEDAGMDFALYPLKILQTEGVLRKGTVLRDQQTGKSVSVRTETKGPIASLVASTSTLEREEEDNRYLILSMNESYQQTCAILEYQRERETLDSEELDRTAHVTAELYQDMLRLIVNRPVINPFASHLSFEMRRHRFRRDQPKILRLVRLVTLSRQYQRESVAIPNSGEVKEYLLSTVEDNVHAMELAAHVMGKSLDEMSPHTRHFLEQFRALIQEKRKASGMESRAIRVLRRELAHHTGLSASTVHAHLQALYRLDYIVFHKDERRRDVVELVDYESGETGVWPDANRLQEDLTLWEARMRKEKGPLFWQK